MKLSGQVDNTKGLQRNDCTVRALSSATGKDYIEVLNVLRMAGRRDNHGFHLKQWLKQNKNQVLGHWFRPVSNLLPCGTFLCSQVGHVWTIKNGIKYDYAGSRASVIRELWEVLPLHPNEFVETKAEIAAKSRLAMIMED